MNLKNLYYAVVIFAIFQKLQFILQLFLLQSPLTSPFVQYLPVGHGLQSDDLTSPTAPLVVVVPSGHFSGSLLPPTQYEFSGQITLSGQPLALLKKPPPGRRGQ